MLRHQKFQILMLVVLLAVSLAPVLPSTASASAPAQGFNCTYTVRPGDNLYRIGLRFGVSTAALAAANNIGNVNRVYVGMTLRVPCSNPNPPPPTPVPGNCGTYVVQRGDWLMSIAARYGVTWQALAAANNLSDPSKITPGMRLVIPCHGGTLPRSITIQQPFPNQTVCSPVRVSGAVNVTPFEATLSGRVLNGSGAVIGEGPVMVQGELGRPGTFHTQLEFDRSRATGIGRIEIAELSAKDGSVVISASVPVRFGCF